MMLVLFLMYTLLMWMYNEVCECKNLSFNDLLPLQPPLCANISIVHWNSLRHSKYAEGHIHGVSCSNPCQPAWIRVTLDACNCVKCLGMVNWPCIRFSLQVFLAVVVLVLPVNTCHYTHTCHIVMAQCEVGRAVPAFVCLFVVFFLFLNRCFFLQWVWWYGGVANDWIGGDVM